MTFSPSFHGQPRLPLFVNLLCRLSLCSPGRPGTHIHLSLSPKCCHVQLISMFIYLPHMHVSVCACMHACVYVCVMPWHACGDQKVT